MRSGVAAATFAALACALCACGTQPGSSDKPGAVDVVATTTQLGDFVREVGGPDFDVHQLLRPNTDPHEYEPRPADVIATSKAKAVFVSGAGLDHWMAKVVKQSGGHPEVVDLAPAAAKDPHWWHDPRNAEAAVRTVAARLIALKPRARAAVTRNAAAYLQRLRRLDAGIARCMARVPPSRRKLVTSHDAFGWFARRYDITVVGAVIPSQTTLAQPSAGAIARLTRLVRREHVTAVFPEASINKKLARALAAQAGATAHYSLYGDTLGPKGSRGATYVQMEQANADSMVRGFTGGHAGCAIAGL